MLAELPLSQGVWQATDAAGNTIVDTVMFTVLDLEDLPVFVFPTVREHDCRWMNLRVNGAPQQTPTSHGGGRLRRQRRGTWCWKTP